MNYICPMYCFRFFGPNIVREVHVDLSSSVPHTARNFVAEFGNQSDGFYNRSFDLNQSSRSRA